MDALEVVKRLGI